MVRVLASGLGNQGLIPGWVLPNTQKWYMMRPCLTLSLIRYRSRVSVVAIEKGTFGLPLTTVCQLTLYIYVYTHTQGYK